MRLQWYIFVKLSILCHKLRHSQITYTSSIKAEPKEKIRKNDFVLAVGLNIYFACDLSAKILFKWQFSCDILYNKAEQRGPHFPTYEHLYHRQYQRSSCGCRINRPRGVYWAPISSFLGIITQSPVNKIGNKTLFKFVLDIKCEGFYRLEMLFSISTRR